MTDRDKLYAWMRARGFPVSGNASVDAMLEQLDIRLLIPDAEQAPSIDDVIIAASDMLGVSAESICGPLRNRAFTDARGYIALVAYRIGAGSYTDIARVLRKDVTSVMTMVKRMGWRVRKLPSSRATFEELEWRAKEIRELRDEQGGNHSDERGDTRQGNPLDSLSTQRHAARVQGSQTLDRPERADVGDADGNRRPGPLARPASVG
jgi:hypothetical protein